MSLATLALVVLSWGKKAPVPAPEPSILQTIPGMTLLAVCACWLLPLVLLKLTATPKHDLALERANALMARINASELRSTLNAALLAIAERTAPEERCIILSGGVDTCAILTAAKQVGVTFAGAITVLTGADAPDAEFAAAAAAASHLEHHVVTMTPADLLETYLPACVQHLATFDGMTLRNSLVVAAAMRRAAALGYKSAVVGDGADELFGGYSFTWGMADDVDGWRAKRDKMCGAWTFATPQLAQLHGLEAHSPYTEPAFVEWALAHTGRAECIGHRPIHLTLGGERLAHACGKVVLHGEKRRPRRARYGPPAAPRGCHHYQICPGLPRAPASLGQAATRAALAWPAHPPVRTLSTSHDPLRPVTTPPLQVVLREAYDTIASWRRKDPIEVGSGVTVISHDAYWADLISDAELHEAKAEALARGFVLKDKEHLANFRAFEQAFGPGGATHPTKRRLGLGLGCAGCCFEIGEATFCEVCGAYPAQRQA